MRVTLVQEQTAAIFVGFLCALALYPADRDNFYLENIEGVVKSGTFILTGFLTAFPFELMSAFGFVVVGDFLIGMKMDWKLYPVYSLTCGVWLTLGKAQEWSFAHSLIMSGLPYCLQISYSVYILWYQTPQRTMLRQSFTISIKNISMPAYYSRYRISQELKNITFTCLADEKIILPDGSTRCIYETGADVRSGFNLIEDLSYKPLIMICCLAVAYRCLTWLILFLKLKVRWWSWSLKNRVIFRLTLRRRRNRPIETHRSPGPPMRCHLEHTVSVPTCHPYKKHENFLLGFSFGSCFSCP